MLHDYEAQGASATIIHPKPYCRGSPLRTDLGMVVASLAIEALSICSGKSLIVFSKSFKNDRTVTKAAGGSSNSSNRVMHGLHARVSLLR